MSVYIENFETILNVKNNIKALRNKVLELAIHGKLVAQDQHDEPASELLKKIQAEREKLLKEGKIKKQKLSEPISVDEIPFEIPVSWKWRRLGDIISITSGEGLTKINMAESGQYPVYGGNGVTGYHNYYNVEEETIVIGRVGFYCGSVHLTPVDSWITDNAFKTTYPKLSINRDWLIQTLKTLDLGRNDNATAQPVISQTKIYPLLIPVPPLTEQHRIVTKIKFLMFEIDKLEESLQKKEHLMKLLPKAVVDAIGKCQTGEELKEQLQFVIENFESVFQTPESMQELRNVVLQLAIEGKLVPQDATDEPASELVKRILVEKDKLVKEGKIKKKQPSKAIEETDVPFEIPDSWEWMRLGNITNLIMGQSPDGDTVTENENIGIEFHQGKSNFGAKLLNISGKYTSDPKKICPKDCLLISVRAPVGTLNYTDREICIGRGLSALIPFKGIHMDYLYSVVTVLEYWLIENSTGTTFKAVTGEVLSNLLLPIPPQAEQHRIVQKVESIMTLIDQMEEELKRKVDLVEKMANI